MESTLRDRRIAAVIPVVALLLSLATLWFLPLLILAYLVLRRTALPFARAVLLRVMDLFLSLILLALAFGAVIAGLDVVARDGEIELLSLINRLLMSGFSLAVDIYGAISLVFSGVRAWRGQLHAAKLSMGILEALRGNRQVTA